jgi:hypothetical protein
MNLTVSPPMIDDFDRLYESASLVVRHPDYPGKRQLEDLILEEIDELFRAGQLDAEQRAVLRRTMKRPD